MVAEVVAVVYRFRAPLVADIERHYLGGVRKFAFCGSEASTWADVYYDAGDSRIVKGMPVMDAMCLIFSDESLDDCIAAIFGMSDDVDDPAVLVV